MAQGLATSAVRCTHPRLAHDAVFFMYPHSYSRSEMGTKVAAYHYYYQAKASRTR